MNVQPAVVSVRPQQKSPIAWPTSPTRQPLPGSLNCPYGHHRTLLRQLLPTPATNATDVVLGPGLNGGSVLSAILFGE